MRWIGVAVLALITTAVNAETITNAHFTEPTTRYAHGVLGDVVEWGALSLSLSDGRQLTMRLPEALVFEDIAPRLADVDLDEDVEVIVVESSQTAGARLSIYDETGRIAATPHIGRPNRWLAPIGAADLDGDGYIEIAYIDRPHLAKTLRIWRYEAGKLTEVASQPGLTNHKIGWDFILGGIRTCDGAPQIITASGDWSRIIASTFDGTAIMMTDVGVYAGPDSLATALSCP